MYIWKDSEYDRYTLMTTPPEFIILKCAVGVLADLIQKDPTMIPSIRPTKFAEAVARILSKMEAASSVNQHLPVQNQALQTSGDGGEVRISTMETGGGCRVSIRPQDGED